MDFREKPNSRTGRNRWSPTNSAWTVFEISSVSLTGQCACVCVCPSSPCLKVIKTLFCWYINTCTYTLSVCFALIKGRRGEGCFRESWIVPPLYNKSRACWETGGTSSWLENSMQWKQLAQPGRRKALLSKGDPVNPVERKSWQRNRKHGQAIAIVWLETLHGGSWHRYMDRVAQNVTVW